MGAGAGDCPSLMEKPDIYLLKVWLECSQRSVPKMEPHFVAFSVGVKESTILFFLSIIKLIEQKSG